MCFKGAQFDMKILLDSKHKELFPLIQEGIYTEKEILKFSQKFGNHAENRPLFHRIMIEILSEKTEWPTKVAKLKGIKTQLISSSYLEWIKTSLFDQLDDCDRLFDSSFLTDVTALKRDIVALIDSYVKNSEQLKDLKVLHNKIKSTLVAFSEQPTVTQYESFSDYICAVIGFFLAVPFALLPLLSNTYCATFFRSSKQNSAGGFISKFDHSPELERFCLSLQD